MIDRHLVTQRELAVVQDAELDHVPVAGRLASREVDARDPYLVVADEPDIRREIIPLRLLLDAEYERHRIVLFRQDDFDRAHSIGENPAVIRDFESSGRNFHKKLHHLGELIFYELLWFSLRAS